MHELSFGKLQSRNRFVARGFTIIELLLVILIVSIITLMSASFYSRFLTQNAVDNTREQLVGSFRKAQTYSMMGKQNGVWGVRYTLSPKKITLYLTGSSAFDEIYNVNNGARFNTYVIPGNIGEITVNGAAARLVEHNDRIIICHYGYLTDEELQRHKPTIILLNEKNEIIRKS